MRILCSGRRMMKNILTLTLLTSASALCAANAAARTPNPSGLVYDRVGIGYVQNDAYDGIQLSGAAILGEGFLVGGSYSNIDGRKDFAGVDGEYSRFHIGYVFYVGAGDIIVTAGYGQGNMYGDAAVVVQDEMALGIAYRQAIAAGLEFSVGYSRIDSTVAAVVDLGGGIIGLDALEEDANVFTLGLRYNFSRQFDLTATYSFQKDEVGGDMLAISAGYNF